MDCSGACLSVYTPVLGEDGVMYPSPCAMRLAKCARSGKKDDWYARYKSLYGSGADDSTSDEGDHDSNKQESPSTENDRSTAPRKFPYDFGDATTDV